jgi:hypothetical protein
MTHIHNPRSQLKEAVTATKEHFDPVGAETHSTRNAPPPSLPLPSLLLCRQPPTQATDLFRGVVLDGASPHQPDGAAGRAIDAGAIDAGAVALRPRSSGSS